MSHSKMQRGRRGWKKPGREEERAQQEGNACVCYFLFFKWKGQREDVDLQVHWAVVSGQCVIQGGIGHMNLNAFQIPLAY